MGKLVDDLRSALTAAGLTSNTGGSERAPITHRETYKAAAFTPERSKSAASSTSLFLEEDYDEEEEAAPWSFQAEVHGIVPGTVRELCLVHPIGIRYAKERFSLEKCYAFRVNLLQPMVPDSATDHGLLSILPAFLPYVKNDGARARITVLGVYSMQRLPRYMSTELVILGTDGKLELVAYQGSYGNPKIVVKEGHAALTTLTTPDWIRTWTPE